MPDPTPNPAPPTAGTPGAGTPPAPATPPVANGGTPPVAPTILNSGTPPVEPTVPIKSVWGDDWRETYSAQDDKRLNVLKRYASPKDMLDAHFALKQRVDSGELKSTKQLPPNANQQEIAAYRKENSIPENAGDYLTNLPNGLVIGEADKPTLTAFAEHMHKANAPPAVVHQAIGWYNAWQEQQAAEVAKADKETKAKTEDTLRADWGANYRANVQATNEFVASAFGDLGKDIVQAVLPDGSRLGDNAQVVQALAKLALEMNPAATLVPNSGGTLGGTGVEARIGEIDKLMAKQGSEYWKGPNSEKIQKEYRDLITARERMKSRNAA